MYEDSGTHRETHLTADDVSHLNSLAIAHYVLGGLGMFFALFPLLYVGFGVMLITGAAEAEVPPYVGGMLVAVGLVLFVAGEAGSIALILSGRHLQRRTGYLFTFVVACISCLSVPVGTILGVFTIIVLSRDSVKAAYGRT